MAVLGRLFTRNSVTPLQKEAPVVAARDLGEYAQGHVPEGTTGVVSAVSRMGTYEVTFAGQVRLINLDNRDIRPYQEETAGSGAAVRVSA